MPCTFSHVQAKDFTLLLPSYCQVYCFTEKSGNNTKQDTTTGHVRSNFCRTVYINLYCMVVRMLLYQGPKDEIVP